MTLNYRNTFLALVLALLCAGPAAGQQRGREEAPPPATVDQATGQKLNEAIELLNQDQYEAAREVLGALRLERLSPYERGRVEQIFASIDYALGNFAEARGHVQAALDSGGLNEQEASQARYQIAQMYLAEEKWAEGAAAMEAWIKTAEAPNSAAYYLLAVAWYQQEEFDKALPNAQQAVTLSPTPQEGWLQLLLALLLQREDYGAALGVLEQAVNLYPGKKVYWMQLSSVYATLEDYPNALAVMQLARLSGMVNEDTDIRRLADLLMVQNSPHRAAELLSEAIENGTVEEDARLHEILANAWIAAREYERSLPVLARAAQLAEDGNLYLRLGEVNMQLEDWEAASAAFAQALDKGGLRDAGNAALLAGIALYNQNEYGEAREWLRRAASSEAQEATARAYLALIDSREAQTESVQ